jgi:hypothetical protein
LVDAEIQRLERRELANLTGESRQLVVTEI